MNAFIRAALLFTIAAYAQVEYEDLARSVAPQFRLTPSEAYFPSPIEYMLPHYVVYADNGTKIVGQPASLTETNLASSLPNQGSSTWLTISDTTASYLVGQNPTSNNVPVYTFIAPKDNGVVDFFYWTFYPWNQGKTIVLLGEVGDHVGDWERLSVRTINGTAVSADYNAHSGGSQAEGTVQWADVPKLSGTNRPIAYVAQGSHGIWSSPGSHIYENVIVYQLTDDTADGGPTWDAQANLFPITYVPGGPYTGTLSWLNFKGNWGNKGETDCWWYDIVQECPLSAGPLGPARDDVIGAASLDSVSIQSKFASMSGPPSHTLGTINARNQSSYSFYIGRTTKNIISKANFSHVAVQQNCVTVQGNSTMKTSHTQTTAIVDGGETRSYGINVAGCTAPGYVSSYQTGLCLSTDALSCIWAQSRTIRVYEAGKSGIRTAAAVSVYDPDNWNWS